MRSYQFIPEIYSNVKYTLQKENFDVIKTKIVLARREEKTWKLLVAFDRNS